MKHSQSGHTTTELAPWLVLGGIAGGVVGVFFKVDAGLAVLAGAGVAIAAFVLISIVAGAIIARAVRKRARQQLRGWFTPGDARFLLFDGDVWFTDGVITNDASRHFGGSHTRYHALGIDVARKRLALASECGTMELASAELHGWRRGSGDGKVFDGKPYTRQFTIELKANRNAGAGGTIFVKRIEFEARSGSEAESIRAALTDALGAESKPYR
jgi:hypothetical protein